MGPSGKQQQPAGGLNYRGPSYPPAGPTSVVGGAGRGGLNLGGAFTPSSSAASSFRSSANREGASERAPRDSLYYLLKSQGKN